MGVDGRPPRPNLKEARRACNIAPAIAFASSLLINDRAMLKPGQTNTRTGSCGLCSRPIAGSSFFAFDTEFCSAGCRERIVSGLHREYTQLMQHATRADEALKRKRSQQAASTVPTRPEGYGVSPIDWWQ